MCEASAFPQSSQFSLLSDKIITVSPLRFFRPVVLTLSVSLLPTAFAQTQAPSNDAASKLNQAAQRERTRSNDPNDPDARQDAARQKTRAGSVGGRFGTSIEPNEAVFIVVAALNACGYDAGLANANPARLRVRQAMAEEVAASADARAAKDVLCRYVREHDLGDPAKTLGQYLSLALMLQPTADLELTAPIPDLPPDATQVVGMLPALKKFADAARLHVLWVQERPAYEAVIAPLRAPLTKELLQISVYLRETAAGNQDRRFIVIPEPMLANGLVNARVYGLDYLMVLAPPETDEQTQRFQQDVRHFYLDFSIAPLIFGYPGAMERLQPLLKAVAEAPIEEVYRDDVEALVSECLIRAIEARTMDTGIRFAPKAEGQRFSGDQARAEIAKQQQAEAIRVAQVQRDMQAGYILTKYFYGELSIYEKSNDSLRDEIGRMVYGMDVDNLRHQARQIRFVSPARSGSDSSVDASVETASFGGLRKRDPSLAKATGVDADPLARAQESLSKGDTESAISLAEDAVKSKQGDPGQATYVIAQAHALQGDMQEAEQNFALALTLTKDPHTVAWSHIYLGRIADIKQDRATALVQYKAALDAKSGLPDAVAAAQKGLAAPYAVPKREAPEEQQ
jgi:tetratricopeptide (TPR) repeat protein